RVGSMDSEVGSLIESLRAGAGRLADDLGAVETGISALYDAASGREHPVAETEPPPRATSEAAAHTAEPEQAPAPTATPIRAPEPAAPPPPPARRPRPRRAGPRCRAAGRTAVRTRTAAGRRGRRSRRRPPD